MSCVAGRRRLGLFNNGDASSGTDEEFSFYNYYSDDSLSGDGCFILDFNAYGTGTQSDEYIEVDPANNYYIFAISTKTITPNYNNHNGSGHLGFACYDKYYNFINHYNIANMYPSVLTRQAYPSDTKIYIDRGDWRIGTGHLISINFFPPSHPDYNIAGEYTRFAIYSDAYSTITDIGGGEFEVNLLKAVPDWGYDLPVGTPVYNTQAGSSYNYALGAPVYPTTWITYYTSPMTGFGNWGTDGFRYGTKYIKYLNLCNYNYRTENTGDSARYLIDNVILLECKSDIVSKFNNLDSSIFSRSKVL